MASIPKFETMPGSTGFIHHVDDAPDHPAESERQALK